MNPEIETICEDRRGRMCLKVVRKRHESGPRYSTIVYRPYKKSEDESGYPVWEKTHWLDEQDVLNARRLHEVADEAIWEAKRRDSFQSTTEAA